MYAKDETSYSPFQVCAVLFFLPRPVVSLSHRSVFPVLFDGEAIDKWWKSALVFKVYCRGSGQKVVSISLRSGLTWLKSSCPFGKGKSL